MKRILLSLILLFTCNSAFLQKSDTSYLEVEGAKIHAVLSSPKKNKQSTLAIIIAGSGPTDLNGNQVMMTNNSLLMLSNSLLKAGIATLRFDKRGIGKSTVEVQDESVMTIDNMVNDVVELIHFAESKGYQNIYILGHSEGSLIGLIAGNKTKIKGFVSIAGTGNPADIVLKKQLKSQLPAEYYAKCEIMLDSLKMGFKVIDHPKELDMLFRESIQPYLISWFAYSPHDLLKTINVPSLIIQGDNDIQIDLEEAKTLKGDLDIPLVVIEGMNHVLKIIEKDRQKNIDSYTNPSIPISKVMVKEIVGFILKN